MLPSTAWHPEFADVNNDGLADLLVTKGNVDAQIDQATRDPSDLFIGQPDGSFVEGARRPGIVDYQRARGAAVVDLNLDGLLDMVIVHRRANVTLWRNVGAGDADQAEAAWVTGSTCGCSSRRRTSTPSARGSTCGAGDTTTDAGGDHRRRPRQRGARLAAQRHRGRRTSAEVRVQWPDGTVGPWMTVRAGERVTIVRGETAPHELDTRGVTR